MHIAISVKDFRAIVLHAETLRTSVQASYSFPIRPMRLTYNEHGMQCEFTLMTIGDYRGSSTTPALVTAGRSPSLPREHIPTRQASMQPTQGDNDRAAASRSNDAMPPPSQPASRSFAQFPQTHAAREGPQHANPSQKPSRPSPPPPKASMDPESLFLPADADDDRQWDEPNLEAEDETLGWDTGAHQVSRDIERGLAMLVAHISEGLPLRNAQGTSATSSRYHSLPAFPEDAEQRIAPTQRLSEVCLLLSSLRSMAYLA